MIRTSRTRIGAWFRAALAVHTWLDAALVIGVGTLIRIPQLSNSLMDSYSFRQTQTAFVVREYARNGIDLFHTPLPVFGPDADVPMELPLFQAFASLLTKLGLDVDIASRMMGLISFQATAILLTVLIARWHGRVAAVSTVVLLEFLPFGLQWGASSMIDFFAVALALSMVLALDLWFERGRIVWLVLGGVSATLAFLVKSTTAPIWCVILIGSTIVFVQRQGWGRAWRRQVVGWLCGPGLGLAAALVWTAYADHVKASHVLTRFLTSDSLVAWNFGTIDQRMAPSLYQVILERITEEILGAGIIVAVLVLAISYHSRPIGERAHLVVWIAASFSGPIVFFNLYYVHDYYLIAIYPALVAVMGISISWLIATIGLAGAPRVRAVVASLSTIILSTALTSQGHALVDGFRNTGPVPVPSQVIMELTEPNDLIVFVGCDWNPAYLYYADRRGVMFMSATTDFLGSVGTPSDARAFWETEDVSRYSLLLSCNGELKPSAFLPDRVRAVVNPVYPDLYDLIQN